MSSQTPTGKRIRIEEHERPQSSASNNSPSHKAINLQRWVWIHVNTLDTMKPGNSGTSTRQYYVPEDVVRQIYNYKNRLEVELTGTKHDDEPVVRDHAVHDPKVFGKALRFLASSYLCPLDATSGSCKDTLGDLVKLYKLSIALSIKRLEKAILLHIDAFEELTLDVFLAFACGYYKAYGAEAQDTSLGDLIKNEDGILGRQLIEVLLEERAAGKAQLKQEAPVDTVKIEFVERK